MSNYKYILYALAYLKRYWLKLIFILLMSVVTISLSLVPVEISKRLIDIAIPAKDLQMVLQMIGIVFGVHLILLVIGYIQDLTITKLNLEVTRKIQSDFFNKLLHVPISYYSHFKEGELMERVIDDADEAVDSTFDLVLSPILDIIGILITIVYMFIISPRLTLVALAFVPVFVLMTLPVNRIIRKKYAVIKKVFAGIYSIIEEKLAGLKEIISHNKGDYETKDLTKHLKSYNELVYDYEKFSTKLESLIEIISDIAPYTILLYATYEIIQGRFQVGTLLAFAMLTPRLFGPVRALAGKELELQTLGITTKRVFSILHDAKAIPEGKEKIKEVKGEIEFKKVSYEYPEAKIFDKLNLKFEPNKMTVIVGGSGVGKSTIFNLLLRILKAKEGQILLDGKDIQKYTTTSLRHYIAIVNQKPFLFSNTILYNLLYGHPEQRASLKEIVKATEIANIHKTILGLPRSYRTHVDEASGRLSTGQIHRITIARAILRQPRILLLDDPTAGLDAESVKHLIAALKRLKEGRTLVIITNDINIAKKADKVVVLAREKGKTYVKEVGRHKELIRKSGFYRGLIAA